ncbi:hypothetical protein GO986_21015 [Deinococcus sp. HMF7620]|uniref:Uncharacterized protein n=1 Tax=Deinococcus arboris TaxID=2682977 RepID=A0A7C9LXJ1_9DEIO|nr:hypothetical protein [Deinococcus arboris]MVN89220.1 hypothetical protein [Deinococcus arboris]
MPRASTDREPYAYIDQLRRQLEDGTMSALELLAFFKSHTPWQTAAWKRRRAELIGDSCGSCGSTEPPMVLQHTWHPRLFGECRTEVQRTLLPPLLPAYLEVHPRPPASPPFDPRTAPPQPFEVRQACPKCQSVNIRQRKDGIWSCNYKSVKYGSPRVVCGHTFQQPVTVEYRRFDDAAWLTKQAAVYEREAQEPGRAWWFAFVNLHWAEIEKQGALLVLEDHRRYVSLRAEDVVTRCKRCAYREDRAFRTGYANGLQAERHREVLVELEQGRLGATEPS